MIQKFQKIGLTFFFACLLVTSAQANNLSISNIALGSRDPGTKSLVIRFDVNWSNSWRNKINHDAVWLTIRLNNTQDVTTNKKLCQITASGINPAGASVGSFSNLEFYVPADKKGAFLRRSSNGNVTNISSTGVQLTIDYNSCGFSDSDQVYASVLGLEMVFIPQGDFYAGDYTTVTALDQGSALNSDPWHITSEGAIAVSDPSSYRYVSGNNPGEFATGSSFNIPDAFPKGYASFYVMKYEITEGQWVEFVNSLGSAAARANRDITDNNHKASDAVTARNTISCSGNPLTCSSLRPARPVSFLSWMDLAAFLDWNALRPLTELEFEKVSRGPMVALPAEFAWGSTDITAGVNINGTEDGSETITDASANANFNGTNFNGGDASQGAQYQMGPLRGGIFAANASDRIKAGASYYGILELSGNLKEHVVTIGNSSGLSFNGQQGDGVLSMVGGYEGNANVLNWPGTDASPANGVTSSNGSGFRGGSWGDASDLLKVSDRSEAALAATSATSFDGGRGARSYDGN